jgi:WD40 repeat protein
MRQAVTQCCFAIVLVTAQARAQVGVPRLGYVWDPGGRALLSVDGVPGASIFGKTEIGAGVAAVAISQHAGVALVIGDDGRSPYLLRVGGKPSEPQPIDGASSHADLIVLSPSGAAAALYDRSANLLQVITGIPQHPVVARALTVAGVDRIAVSDDGLLLALAARDGAASALMPDAGEPVSLPVPGPVSSIAFRPLSHDVLVASGGVITLMRNVDSHANYQPITDIPGDPVALAFSADGRGFVAAYADGRVQMSDLSSGGLPPVRCLCRPTGLEPLAGGSIFALRTDESPALFLFDAATNRVVFVGRGEQ